MNALKFVHSVSFNCNVMFLDLTKSGMKLVKVFRGGQTVTLGKSSSEMGRVSRVVVTGLSAQLEKDCWIKTAATVKPVMTTHSQSSLATPLVLEMYARPWMVEDSRNSLTVSMLKVSTALWPHLRLNRTTNYLNVSLLFAVKHSCEKGNQVSK